MCPSPTELDPFYLCPPTPGTILWNRPRLSHPDPPCDIHDHGKSQSPSLKGRAPSRDLIPSICISCRLVWLTQQFHPRSTAWATPSLTPKALGGDKTSPAPWENGILGFPPLDPCSAQGKHANSDLTLNVPAWRRSSHATQTLSSF